jgi:hypothetical protein
MFSRATFYDQKCDDQKRGDETPRENERRRAAANLVPGAVLRTRDPFPKHSCRDRYTETVLAYPRRCRKRCTS